MGPRDRWWDDNIKRAYEVISKDKDFEEIADIFPEEFQLNNVDHHGAVAVWAQARFPPFGNEKDKTNKK